MRTAWTLLWGLGIGLGTFVGMADTNRVNFIYSTYEDLLLRRLDAHYHAGEFHQSANIYQILYGIHPDDATLVRTWAWMLGNANEFDEAFSVMMSFRLAHPSDARAALGEAELFVQQAREEDRLPRAGPPGPGSSLWWRVPPLLEPHLQKKDLPVNAYTFLSASYEKVGLLRQALRVWELRQERFPDDPACTPNINRLKKLLQGKG
ncbi:MAG: hypothetical protein K6T17_08420 [Fimbriimonadales bacterium]|nr:hypothetical protein [Fimbriimonadales bacterium]